MGYATTLPNNQPLKLGFCAEELQFHKKPILPPLQSRNLKRTKRNGTATLILVNVKINLVWLHKLLIGDCPPRTVGF